MFSSNTSQVSSGGYEIQRSLRFNSADSAYLDRTPASSGNRRIWTWSGWVKKTIVGDGRFPALFGAQNSTRDVLRFNGEALNVFFNNTTSANIVTTAVYRDVSAWYHVVLAVDTTQATDTNRVKLYVNGVQVTAFSTASYPAQNYDTFVNMNVAQRIGSDANLSDGYFNGYMTEINFIDGQALTPSSFGAYDAQTGVWGPTPYAGSYGTNGFYLNFSDNSNTTAATLGKDYSGNSNNWTPNNFSVSAGAGNDSLVDVPTNWGTDTGVGGTVRGNYCTWNSVDNLELTLTNGNLDASFGAAAWRAARSTVGMSSGKWYCEITMTTVDNIIIGLMTSQAALNNNAGQDAYGWGYYSATGNKKTNGTLSAYGASYTNGDIIGIAFDADAGTLTFYKNNTSQGTAFTGLTSGPYLFAISLYGTCATSANFGQRPFAYTAPSGFKALNTQNLPTPTIGATTATQANKYFDVVLRNGGAPSGGTYSTTVNMANGALLWDKPRNSASSNYLVDSVRGISKNLRSNTTDAEATDVSWFTGFNSSSFTTGSSDWGSSTTVVDWIWAANGAGVTNTAGSITSTVSANTTSGFSVVTYNNSSINYPTVGHGLGVAPAFIIAKSRTDATGGWAVYHQSLPNPPRSQFLALNTTDAATSVPDYWGTSGAFTSTTFGVGLVGFWNNRANMVAYCFAEVPGYSKFGSYTGNGSDDGPFVYCGFRPKYLMIKNTTSTAAWNILDAARSPSNTISLYLDANSSSAEASYPAWEFLSNGFKLRKGAGISLNENGNNYIFVAFAESPFKYALAR